MPARLHSLRFILLLAGCVPDPCCGRRGLVPECPDYPIPPDPDPPIKPFELRSTAVIVDGIPRDVTYVDDGVLGIYQGDIILGPASELRPRPGRSSMTPVLGLRWGDRTMPVVIDSSAAGFTAQINAGLGLWTAVTTMRFPTRTTEADYVVFRSTTNGWGSSSLGMVGGEQTIYLPTGTDAALVAHEVGHALGLYHEHARPDRDQYINVYNDRVADPINASAFSRDAWDSVWLGGEYDFASIMHYPSCAFAKRTATGCDPTITRKDGSLIPWNAAVTPSDACGVLQMYDLATFNATCNDAGLDCRREQEGFVWNCDDEPDASGCVAIEEPADPHGAWQGNWLCPPEGLDLAWSYAGEVPGMRCVAVTEAVEPPEATWTDNYLCWRSTDPTQPQYRFHWSMAGPIANLPCLQWVEPRDPSTWTDNYLCWSREPWPNITIELTDIDDEAYLWVGEPADPAEAVCTARFAQGHPGSMTCNLGFFVNQRGRDRLSFTLKYGNGGGWDSSGHVRILVDGNVVKDKVKSKVVRHTGWFYRLAFEIDAQLGSYREIDENECRQIFDCPD